MRPFSKTVLIAYSLFLLWLILFKTSIDFSGVVLYHQSRSLNLIPLADASAGNVRGIIDNVVVFIPLGLLLDACFERINFWRKLSVIFLFSLTVEIIQFVLAIGVSDITDVIANTLGGVIGLSFYNVAGAHIESEKLSRIIALVVSVLLIVFLFLRFFVFRVKY